MTIEKLRNINEYKYFIDWLTNNQFNKVGAITDYHNRGRRIVTITAEKYGRQYKIVCGEYVVTVSYTKQNADGTTHTSPTLIYNYNLLFKSYFN